MKDRPIVGVIVPSTAAGEEKEQKAFSLAEAVILRTEAKISEVLRSEGIEEEKARKIARKICKALKLP